MRPHAVFALLLLTAACGDPDRFDEDGDGYCGIAIDPEGDTPACADEGVLQGDCDDGDAEIYPGATEWCDGIDTDCDGSIDEPEAIDADVWYTDADQDGLGDPARFAKACEEPIGWVRDNTDCDDSDPAVGACR